MGPIRKSSNIEEAPEGSAEYRRHPSTDLVEAYRPVFWAIISTQRLTTSVDTKFPCGHDKHSLRSYRQELEELQVHNILETL